jgi:hypothetical protein
MRCGILVLVLTAIEALLLSLRRERVARERTAFVRAGDGAAGRPGEEPRLVSDTRGGVMSEPLLDAAGPPSLTRHAAGISRRPAAAQHGR